jgi:hypothetical protein
MAPRRVKCGIITRQSALGWQQAAPIAGREPPPRSLKRLFVLSARVPSSDFQHIEVPFRTDLRLTAACRRATIIKALRPIPSVKKTGDPAKTINNLKNKTANLARI